MTNFSILFVIFFVILGARASDQVYSIEREINLSLENSGLLILEKEQLEQKAVELQQKIRQRKRLLLKRVGSLAYLKKYQWGMLVSKSETIGQLDRNLKILKNLSSYDIEIFKDYRKSLIALSTSRAALEATLKEIDFNVEKLKVQQLELIAKETLHLAEVKNKNLPSLIKLKGELPRPLDGLLLWPFGSRVDDSKQYVFVSKGLLFKTTIGSQIKSIGPGVIIFSDVVDHWRETLIIQHEDNYYSVYSGLKSADLRVNNSVEKNQLIGHANSEEFYFELRHFDNPINPKTWFKESL